MTEWIDKRSFTVAIFRVVHRMREGYQPDKQTMNQYLEDLRMKPVDNEEWKEIVGCTDLLGEILKDFFARRPLGWLKK